MSRARGQALLETALCLPVGLVIALGGVALVRVADARAGLDAATSAAVAAAARAPDTAAAEAAARERFQAISAGYPIQSAGLTLDLAGFYRGGRIGARGYGAPDLSFAPIPGLGRSIALSSSAAARAEDWRSRTPR